MQSSQNSCQIEPNGTQSVDGTPVDNATKQPFISPKLTFLTPKLTKQGSVEALTAGLISTFSP